MQINDNILNALASSQFLKKMWIIRITDLRSVSPEGIINILSSENLHPFFDVEKFLNNLKTIINDEIIISMSENYLCVNNLFYLNLEGCNKITEKAIETLLTSKYLCPYFHFTDFLNDIRYKYKHNSSKIIQLLPDCVFTKNIEILGLNEYDISEQTLEKILISPSPFNNIIEIHLDETGLTDNCLKILSESDIIEKIVVLTLNRNKKISQNGFEEFFNELSNNHKIKIKRFELEFCQINRKSIETFCNSPWVMIVKHFSISGSRFIDYEALTLILDISLKYKILNVDYIYEDYKIYVLKNEDGTYKKRENIDFDFLKQAKRIIEKERPLIGDNIVKNFCEDERLLKFTNLDLHNCAITSESLKYLANSNFSKRIEILNLSQTNINDDGIKYLVLSENLRNLKEIVLKDCEFITEEGVEEIIKSENFSMLFNPDKILTEFSDFISKQMINVLTNSAYLINIKNIDLSKTDDLDIEDLFNLIKMSNINKKLKIKLNLHKIINQYKSEINDELIQIISESSILSGEKSLDLSGANISKDSLKSLFLSKYLHKSFDVQKIINNFADLIDDDILNYLSRLFFLFFM